MKNILIIIFVLTVMQITTVGVFAQTITLSATDSAHTASPAATTQYDLPYPGILPNHPLYFLKVVRDHVVGFLINDPVKKAEFNLLQSDKKLFAATMLLENDADQLSIDTLSKSNNYMHSAVSDAKRADSANFVTENVVGKIGASINKHEEMILNMMNTDSSIKASLQGELKRLRSIEDFYRKSFPKKAIPNS